MFVRYFVKRGIYKDVAKLIKFPPVWKWFTHSWIQCNQNVDEFFTKCLPTNAKKLRFMNELAKNGLLSLMQWARANGCPWNIYTCAWAARFGNLEALQWLRANGCPWNKYTCNWAARYGHLEVLQWARANGCPE